MHSCVQLCNVVNGIFFNLLVAHRLGPLGRRRDDRGAERFDPGHLEPLVGVEDGPDGDLEAAGAQSPQGYDSQLVLVNFLILN